MRAKREKNRDKIKEVCKQLTDIQVVLTTSTNYDPKNPADIKAFKNLVWATEALTYLSDKQVNRADRYTEEKMKDE